MKKKLTAKQQLENKLTDLFGVKTTVVSVDPNYIIVWSKYQVAIQQVAEKLNFRLDASKENRCIYFMGEMSQSAILEPIHDK